MCGHEEVGDNQNFSSNSIKGSRIYETILMQTEAAKCQVPSEFRRADRHCLGKSLEAPRMDLEDGSSLTKRRGRGKVSHSGGSV